MASSQDLEILEEKIADKMILDADNHWIWTGAADKYGHGQIKFQGKTCYVHRIVAIIFINSSLDLHPSNLAEDLVLHKCREASCINPEHLYIGTQSDNMWDRSHDGNHPNANKTHCIHGHEYTEENTYWRKGGHRCCRICKNLRSQQYRNNQKIKT